MHGMSMDGLEGLAGSGAAGRAGASCAGATDASPRPSTGRVTGVPVQPAKELAGAGKGTGEVGRRGGGAGTCRAVTATSAPWGELWVAGSEGGPLESMTAAGTGGTRAGG